MEFWHPQNCHFPLTCCVALTTVWHYRVTLWWTGTRWTLGRAVHNGWKCTEMTAAGRDPNSRARCHCVQVHSRWGCRSKMREYWSFVMWWNWLWQNQPCFLCMCFFAILFYRLYWVLLILLLLFLLFIISIFFLIWTIGLIQINDWLINMCFKRPKNKLVTVFEIFEM